MNGIAVKLVYMDKRDVVSAFEAKTHLSELLRETERGHAYTIERRGKPVARLVPPTAGAKKGDWPGLAASFREIRSRIAKRGGKLRVRDLIEEGRRA